MTINGWLQITLLFVLIVATARPLGVFTANVLEGKTSALDKVFGSRTIRPSRILSVPSRASAIARTKGYEPAGRASGLYG